MTRLPREFPGKRRASTSLRWLGHILRCAPDDKPDLEGGWSEAQPTAAVAATVGYAAMRLHPPLWVGIQWAGTSSMPRKGRDKKMGRARPIVVAKDGLHVRSARPCSLCRLGKIEVQRVSLLFRWAVLEMLGTAV